LKAFPGDERARLQVSVFGCRYTSTPIDPDAFSMKQMRCATLEGVWLLET
jgi:hypothetical protein